MKATFLKKVVFKLTGFDQLYICELAVDRVCNERIDLPNKDREWKLLKSITTYLIYLFADSRSSLSFSLFSKTQLMAISLLANSLANVTIDKYINCKLWRQQLISFITIQENGCSKLRRQRPFD